MGRIGLPCWPIGSHAIPGRRQNRAAGGGMRFGFFDQLPCAPGFTEQQRYHDILAQIDLGDEVGFVTVWLGELHFSRAFSILTDPFMLLGAAPRHTSLPRVSSAVT